MVGFRIFDLCLLVAWLVWFFRLRDDGESPDGGEGDDGGGGPHPDSPGPPGDGGIGRTMPGGVRLRPRMRDHRPPATQPTARRGDPLRHPAPARVRRPARRRSPARA
jgi:hypothetical protein